MVMTSRHARQQRIGTKVAFLSAAWIACARVVDSFFVKLACHRRASLRQTPLHLLQLSWSVLTILRLPYGKVANHAHKRCGYRSNECGRASAARRPFLTRQIVQKEFNGIVFDHCCSLRHTFSQRVDLFSVQDLIRAFEELPYTGPVHFQLQPADPERTKNKLLLSSMALIG